jgi:glutamine synthetase
MGQGSRAPGSAQCQGDSRYHAGAYPEGDDRTLRDPQGADPAESESRYHIYLEKYSKQINIEAGVMVDMAKRMLFPAVGSFAASLARDSSSLAAIGATSVAIEKRAKRLAELAARNLRRNRKLEKVLVEAQEVEDAFVQAKAYREKVVPQMSTLRVKVDAAEKLVEKKYWPLPTYEELLFKL